MKIKKGYILSAVLIALLCAFAMYSYNAYRFKKASRDILYQLSREGANKQVISSQADSLIKISRIWADF
ncbi:hypothetical protein, partial [Enterobacter asburiae]|uniref:hypothetical protein n=1 Tax=Enterobacter asburiae TaxID=61645 RepID=UPI00075ADF0C